MDDRRVITVRGLYELLLEHLGPTHWWPADTRFEIAVGAILTQNTAWSNVAIALDELKARNALRPEAILSMSDETLGKLIRPAGYWRTKTGYLKTFCSWFAEVQASSGNRMCSGTSDYDDRIPKLVADRTDAELRDELLALRGIGGETADDLMLYVFDRPAFIADRYARRLFETLGVRNLPPSYEGFRAIVQPHVKGWDIAELKEFHGLIDDLGKTMRATEDWKTSFVARCRLTFLSLSHVEHGFGPVWDASSRVLVLGSMPSPKSRDMKFYYGHPRNRFWPVMAQVFNDESCLPSKQEDTHDAERIAALVERRRQFALRHHMALWDVIASCDIVGASDASIRNAEPNDIASIISRSRITHVFTTGAKAAQLYRMLCLPRLEPLGYGLQDLPMTQLPSTSPANASASLSELVDVYCGIRTIAEQSGKEVCNVHEGYAEKSQDRRDESQGQGQAQSDQPDIGGYSEHGDRQRP